MRTRETGAAEKFQLFLEASVSRYPLCKKKKNPKNPKKAKTVRKGKGSVAGPQQGRAEDSTTHCIVYLLGKLPPPRGPQKHHKKSSKPKKKAKKNQQTKKLDLRARKPKEMKKKGERQNNGLAINTCCVV